MEARPTGSLGPRLAGRLTADLIMRSPQYMSCIKLYEIDLRGNKIGAIENLGVTENQFDSVDLTDNAIMRLEGFPRLPRLKMLLVANNRVAKISRGLETSIPNLEVLVLANNKITELKDIDPLSSLPKLYSLSLAGNPVALKKEYRLYTISRCPKLKHLDFKKVKQKEREQAETVYGTLEQQVAAAAEGRDNTFEPGEGLPEQAMETEEQAAAEGGEGAGAAAADGGAADANGEGAAAAAKPTSAPSADQLTAIKAAVANAQTLEDAWRLEQALQAGAMPSALAAEEEEQQRQQQQDGAAAMDEG
ncbi:U2 small nuclear ribonucleoprotein A-like protein [Scenedesmus sp. PABB004]|nr:U2 small nuclear ribonucleoprotein A-like protein [Scenedesmus sp. PABB004]